MNTVEDDESVRVYNHNRYDKSHETILVNFHSLAKAQNSPSWGPLYIVTREKFPADGFNMFSSHIQY